MKTNKEVLDLIIKRYLCSITKRHRVVRYSGPVVSYNYCKLCDEKIGNYIK